VKSKSKGGSVSRIESISGEHSDAPPLSSFIADTTTDREEGPSTKRTSRRSAANKATQRLREEVMPDVVNFEKEMRRGQVRAANFSPKVSVSGGRRRRKRIYWRSRWARVGSARQSTTLLQWKKTYLLIVNTNTSVHPKNDGGSVTRGLMIVLRIVMTMGAQT
jgi:hypothetical protein